MTATANKEQTKFQQAADRAEQRLEQIVALKGGARRDGQVRMARGIANILSRTTPGQHKHAVVQGGTGIGKSLAWLAGGVAADPVWANNPLTGARHRLPLLAVTHSKALMDQLVDDLTLLDESGDLPFTWALLKGRASYLCLDALNSDQEDQGIQDTLDAPTPTTSHSEAAKEWKRLYEWAEQTTTGDRSDLDEPVSNKTWTQVSRSGDDCKKKGCPFFEKCFAEQAARKASTSDVIVTNMSLLALDMRLRSESAGNATILPDYGHVIIDEAHEFPSVVSDAFGAEVTIKRITDTFKSLESIAHKHGGDKDKVAKIVKSGTKAAKNLEKTLPKTGRYEADREAPTDPKVLADVDTIIASLEVAYRSAQAMLPSNTAEEQAAARPMLRHFTNLIEALHLITQGSTDNQVAWVDSDIKGTPVMHCARFEVADTIADNLLTTHSTVFTSATLTTGGKFDLLTTRMGLDKIGEEGKDYWTHIVPAPFDYPEQSMLYLPDQMPDIKTSKEQHLEAASKDIAARVQAAGGRTLVLCHSWKQAETVSAHLADLLPDTYTVIAQEKGGQPAKVYASKFIHTPHSVLVGVRSFWTGVSFPGDLVTFVAIVACPFPSPSDPVIAARSEAADKVKKWAGFTTVSVPEASLLITQGAGRLIRTVHDRGVVALYDPRLNPSSAHKKWYGRTVLADLPDFTRTHDPAAVDAFLSAIDSEASTLQVDPTQEMEQDDDMDSDLDSEE